MHLQSFEFSGGAPPVQAGYQQQGGYQQQQGGYPRQQYQQGQYRGQGGGNTTVVVQDRGGGYGGDGFATGMSTVFYLIMHYAVSVTILYPIQHLFNIWEKLLAQHSTLIYPGPQINSSDIHPFFHQSSISFLKTE